MDKNLIKDIYTLTPVQSGILFHCLNSDDKEVYLIQNSVTFRAQLNLEVFNKSLEFLINKHDIFRTIFYRKDDKVLQIVVKKRQFDLIFYDYTGNPEELNLKLIEDLKRTEREKGFRLDNEYLFRILLIRVENNKYFFIWTIHHLLIDGWSFTLAFTDLISIYRAILDGSTPSLETSQFSSYIKWLETQPEGEAFDFWKEYLKNSSTKSLPFYTEENGSINSSLEESTVTLSREMWQEIKELARREKTTSNIIFQAVWGLLLQKYSDEKDVMYGVVVSGRNPEITNIEKTVGVFINTIPFRSISSKEDRFDAYLSKTHDSFTNIHKYDYFPLGRIKNEIWKGEDVVNHIFVYENYPLSDVTVNDVSKDELLSIVDSTSFEKTHYNFVIQILPGNDCVVSIKYNSGSFSADNVNKILRTYIKLLNIIIVNPQVYIDDISIIAEEEEKKIDFFNQTEVPYNLDITLNDIIRETCKIFPSNIAIATIDKELTFDEVDKQSNKVARFLRSQDVSRDEIVGVMMERSIEMYIAIYGIVKAGAAYLPILPSSPEERLSFYIKNSKAKLILAETSILNVSIPVVNIKDERIIQQSEDAVELINRPEDLVYVMYTSGSTGEPKGVMIQHNSLLNRIYWMQDAYKIDPNARLIQKTPFTFDVSVWEIFWGMFTGAHLFVLPPELEKEPASLLNTIRCEEISVVHFVPTMLNTLLNYVIESNISLEQMKLKKVICSGEALDTSLVEKFYKYFASDIQLINLYGPTEAAIDVTYFDLNPTVSVKTIPIGKPISNIKIEIVDSNNNRVPIGVFGNICIKGIGVSRGYINDRNRTAERFHGEGENRTYFTGDLGRWQEDGNIEFLGRNDDQIKIRGNRVELGEIEKVLLRHPDIKAAALVVNKVSELDLRLVAFYSADSNISTLSLRKHLKEWLPDYMIPSKFIFLKSIPINSSGKKDKKALLQSIDFLASPNEEKTRPTSDIEQEIAQIWKDVIKIDKLFLEDNFFDLGGHSLLSIKVAGILKHKYGVEPELKDFLNHTFGQFLAAYTRKLTEAKQQSYHGSILFK